MQENSVIQYFERKNTIELLLNVLEVRFQHSDVPILKPTLENIEENQRLRELHRKAVQVPSLDEFKRILELKEN